MKIYYYSCSWQDCALSMHIVSLHLKNIAFENKSAPLISYISKKGHDLQADSSPHQSLRAGGSHLIQSHQKSVVLGTCHSLGAGWELVTRSQKWEHFGGREEKLFIQKWTHWCTKSCSQLPGGPSISSKLNLPGCWRTYVLFHFFKDK